MSMNDTKNPLISVIIPVYNVADYLDKCIMSVMEQTYQDLEIILVDDGSTDGSGDICDTYASKDSRITVIHKDNGGQGSARNRGLDAAKGEYVSFLDSDDSLYSNCIEILYRIMVEHDVDVAACNSEMYDENGEFIRRFRERDDDYYAEYGSFETIESIWTRGDINLAAWAKLYKRQIWNSIRFKEIHFVEDLATMHYVYKKTGKTGFTGKCGLRYLVRKGSSIRSFNDKKLAALDAADDIVRFGEEHDGLVCPARQRAVSAYFHILFQLPKDIEHDAVRQRIVRSVRGLRPYVLKDRRCSKKVRYALLLSYFGFGVTEAVFRVIKRRDPLF